MLRLVSAVVPLLGLVMISGARAPRSECPGPMQVYGEIKVVENFADCEIEVVESFEDLRVQIVDNFADEPGEWEMVTNFPDYTVEFVESFPDFTIRYVESFPGTDD